jgi:hypothetical protein
MVPNLTTLRRLHEQGQYVMPKDCTLTVPGGGARARGWGGGGGGELKTAGA